MLLNLFRSFAQEAFRKALLMIIESSEETNKYERWVMF